MKKFLLLLCVFAGSASVSNAAPSFTRTDFSGAYACTGNDAKEGQYTGKVTLKRVDSQSAEPYAAYDFRLDVPGYGSYPGHGAAKGTDMAIYFANTDSATKDFGTGIASFKKTKNGKWSFRKFYYEPEFKGGNHGIEECVQQ